MIVSTYLRSLFVTAVAFVTLPLCWHTVPLMIGWLFGFACYLLLVLCGLIDLDHIEHRLLPKDTDLAEERGLPSPSSYPPMPKVFPPFRFVGVSERDRSLKCRCGTCSPDLGAQQ